MAMCNMQHEKLFTQNVTNVTFIFQTLQIQTYDKKVGETRHTMSPHLKSGGTRPLCPPPNCAHAWK